MLSGPAGAVVGAAQLCGQAGYRDLITMDIGGTSLDTCLVRGSVAEATTTREIDMFPLAIPMLDVHTIGAGGGSVVRVDDVPAGSRSGRRAWARGRDRPVTDSGGGRATLTDVNLLMGLIDADGFADGEVSLDRARARSGRRSARSPGRSGSTWAARRWAFTGSPPPRSRKRSER